MHARVPLPDPGILGSFIKSFEYHLRSEDKADSTRDGYLGAAKRLAGWLLDPAVPDDVEPEAMRKLPTAQGRLLPVEDWSKVGTGHIKLYLIYLSEVIGYDAGYVNNQFRAIQQFWKWYSQEEGVPNPMLGLKPPDPGQKLVPVIATEQLATLIQDAEAGRDFESRRDAALLRLFACTGARLAEITALDVTDVDLANRIAQVLGKGRKERLVKFDARAARALDRYLRVRDKHSAVTRYGVTALWIGVRRHQGMTANGVRQVVKRRAARLGMKIHPHMFRHTMTSNWLDKGGAEGDLMELNGWTSPQMLRRYGRSVAAKRAQRAYDRIDVMDGV